MLTDFFIDSQAAFHGTASHALVSVHQAIRYHSAAFRLRSAHNEQ